MRHLASILLLLLLLLSACGGPSGVPDDKVPVPAASMFFEKEHLFSHPSMPDKFLLGYYGHSLLDTSVQFFILNAANDTIFRDQWEARLFLDSSSTTLSDSVAEQMVMEQMRSLLDKQMPMAHTGGDSILPANSFSYGVGGYGHVLEWSAEQQKVVVRN